MRLLNVVQTKTVLQDRSVQFWGFFTHFDIPQPFLPASLPQECLLDRHSSTEIISDEASANSWWIHWWSSWILVGPASGLRWIFPFFFRTWLFDIGHLPPAIDILFSGVSLIYFSSTCPVSLKFCQNKNTERLSGSLENYHSRQCLTSSKGNIKKLFPAQDFCTVFYVFLCMPHFSLVTSLCFCVIICDITEHFQDLRMYYVCIVNLLSPELLLSVDYSPFKWCSRVYFKWNERPERFSDFAFQC